MKKQKKYPVSKLVTPESSVNSKAHYSMQDNKDASLPPNEETISKLNAIAREYPFCVNFKQQNSFLL